MDGLLALASFIGGMVTLLVLEFVRDHLNSIRLKEQRSAELQQQARNELQAVMLDLRSATARLFLDKVEVGKST